jgi:hypothetical protein
MTSFLLSSATAPMARALLPAPEKRAKRDAMPGIFDEVSEEGMEMMHEVQANIARMSKLYV